MAKNFGKILLGLTAAGAAGAGAYYWLKNRHNEEPEDEFDDTFEDDDFELDDDLGEVPERGYTTLTPSSAKEETSEESEKKLTMQKPDQKPLPRHRKLIPKNPIRLQKKFKKELILQLIIFCIKPNPEEFFILTGFFIAISFQKLSTNTLFAIKF